MFLNIEIPKHAKAIIHTLNSHGYEAYVVGGCVRDSILGKHPADWDITTSARPEQVKALFSKTIDTGIKHGTVTIMMGKEGYEVTTYRVGGSCTDLSCLEVTFADNLKEDLAHRDFTINAMAYHPEEGLVDYFGGLMDLDSRIIRGVGNAAERFQEDPLRMLRAVRFAGQLHFSVEEHTMEAIQAHHTMLERVSKERLQMELLKLLISDHPEVIRLAYTSGLTSVFLPEFDAMMQTEQNNPHHCYTVGEHTIRAICLISANPVLRLAMLFHDIAKPVTKKTDEYGIDHFSGHYRVGADMAQSIMKRLKFDNNTTRLVSTLVRYHDTRFQNALTTGRRQIRKIMSEITPSLFPYLVEVMHADVLAQSTYLQNEKLAALAEASQASEEILNAGDCLSLKELKINGNDLKSLGITDGKTIGSILQLLLNMVLENPSLNDFLYLKELALKIYQEL